MTSPPTTIHARSLINFDKSIVDNAEILADQVIDRLRAGQSVRISMAGVRGASSSYFNVILRRVVDAFGADALRERVAFEFDSPVQKHIFERSLEAVGRAA